MSVIVLTRGGLGDAWLHDSVRDADGHPITQYGDPIIGSAEGLRTVLRLPEVRQWAERLGDRATVAEVDYLISAGRGSGQAHDMLWETLRLCVSRPPSVPAEIIEIVRRDREWTRENGVRVFPRQQGEVGMSNTEVAATEETTMEKKARAPRTSKYSPEQVINFGKNDEGIEYNGTDNNPKRPGSKAFDHFARYRNGMTVAEAKAAGQDARDFDFDTKRGFITIT